MTAAIISAAIFLAAVCTACTPYQKEELSQDTSEPLDWRSLAENFLSNYPSLFGTDMISNKNENPEAFVYFDFALNGDNTHSGRMYFDRSGEVIHEAPFLLGQAPEQFVAWDYTLIDLDNNGVPAIVINYVYPESSGNSSYNVYRFIDGAFILTGAFYHPQFFRNNDGYVIVFEWYNDQLRVSRSIPDDRTHFELVSDLGEFWWGDVNDKTPALFDMLNEPLTPIEPLTELQQSVTESVLQILDK
jgi:hypothetical protein